MIIYKNKKAEELDVVFSAFPTLPAGMFRDEPIIIPGRHGVLHPKNEMLSPIDLLLEGHAQCGEPALREWLNGHGKLVLENRPECYWEAYVRLLEVTQIVEGELLQFSVTFELEPFSYLVSGQEEIKGGADALSLTNLGVIDAYPHIRVDFSGETAAFSVLKNGHPVLEVEDAKEKSIEMDALLDLIYSADKPLDKYAKGGVPVLEVGKTTALQITSGKPLTWRVVPNWRGL